MAYRAHGWRRFRLCGYSADPMHCQVLQMLHTIICTSLSTAAVMSRQASLVGINTETQFTLVHNRWAFRLMSLLFSFAIKFYAAPFAAIRWVWLWFQTRGQMLFKPFLSTMMFIFLKSFVALDASQSFSISFMRLHVTD